MIAEQYREDYKGNKLVSSILPGVAQALDESTYCPESTVKLIGVVGRL